MANAVVRILVIDDEPRMCESLKTLLTNIGYEVETAANGREGVAKLKAGAFALAISDLMMPEVDGFGVLEHVRSTCPETVVLVITGYASVDSAIRAIRAGAYDYILKPFDFDIIRISVERALEKAHLQETVSLSRAYTQLAQDVMDYHRDMMDPLTVMSGYAQLLERAGAVSESGEIYLQEILGASIQMSARLSALEKLYAQYLAPKDENAPLGDTLR